MKRKNDESQQVKCLNCGNHRWKTDVKNYGRRLTVSCRNCGHRKGA